MSDSTVLRNIGVAFAHAILAYQSIRKGLSKVIPNPDKIETDLNQHWEILAEPIQIIMRKFGIDQPYEKLKHFTRGQTITQPLLQQFIKELSLPDDIKKQLLELTPLNYIGYASDLAKGI